MRTIALRFSDNFAPPDGTIAEHRKCIYKKGFVWYGKLGSPVSERVCTELLENESPRFLLIHSGKSARYWAYTDRIIKSVPALEDVPEYYRFQADSFRTWFRLIDIEEADKSVMSRCRVASSGMLLSIASRSSMSPYFIIDYTDDEART